MNETLVLGLIVLAMIAFLSWREWVHARIIKDLSSKIKAGSIHEYKMAEYVPKPKAKDKNGLKPVIDPVLGPNF